MRPNGKKRVEIPWKYIRFRGCTPSPTHDPQVVASDHRAAAQIVEEYETPVTSGNCSTGSSPST
jgi:hypothetical protein